MSLETPSTPVPPQGIYACCGREGRKRWYDVHQHVVHGAPHPEEWPREDCSGCPRPPPETPAGSGKAVVVVCSSCGMRRNKDTKNRWKMLTDSTSKNCNIAGRSHRWETEKAAPS